VRSNRARRLPARRAAPRERSNSIDVWVFNLAPSAGFHEVTRSRGV
jgi:hypothetical protein